MKRFIYRELELDFDDSKILIQEGIWLERATGYTARDVMVSWQSGGALGIACWLMLALRRNGRSDLAKWERLQSINILTTGGGELDLVDLDALAESSEEGEEGADPTGSASPSTGEPPEGTPVPAKAPTKGRSPRKSGRTSRTS